MNFEQGVINIYDNVSQTCKRMAKDGSQIEADYIGDTSYWNYYYRLMNHNQYCEWVKEQMKKTP